MSIEKKRCVIAQYFGLQNKASMGARKQNKNTDIKEHVTEIIGN